MTHEPHAYCQAQTRRFDARIFLPVLVGCMLVLNSTLFYLNRKGLPHRGFRNFYVGAVILASRCGAELYTLGLHRHFQAELLLIRPEGALPYNHPAFELFVFSPFACLSYVQVFYPWFAISAGLGIIAAAVLAWKPQRLSTWAAFHPAVANRDALTDTLDRENAQHKAAQAVVERTYEKMSVGSRVKIHSNYNCAGLF